MPTLAASACLSNIVTTALLPTENFSIDGNDVLGARIGLPDLMDNFLNGKMDGCGRTLTLIDGNGDARIRFDVRRVWACKLQHVMKLTPPSAATALAKRFYQHQMEY